MASSSARCCCCCTTLLTEQQPWLTCACLDTLALTVAHDAVVKIDDGHAPHPAVGNARKLDAVVPQFVVVGVVDAGRKAEGEELHAHVKHRALIGPQLWRPLEHHGAGQRALDRHAVAADGQDACGEAQQLPAAADLGGGVRATQPARERARGGNGLCVCAKGGEPGGAPQAQLPSAHSHACAHQLTARVPSCPLRHRPLSAARSG